METNPQTTSTSPSSFSLAALEIRRRKRIKLQTQQSTITNPNSSSSSWKSQKTQELYSTKLLTALQNVHITPPTPSAPRRSRAVREAADIALATAAKGRTRWSRAILTNKVKIKYINKIHKRQKINVTGPSRLPPQATKLLSLKVKGKAKELPGVERKVKTLGRLVPGCGKETLPVILEEATDYIPALEMQIRAMRDLLSRLSAASSASTTATDDGGPPSSPPPADAESR